MKNFGWKKSFKDLSMFYMNEEGDSEDVYHFGILWMMNIIRDENHLSFNITCHECFEDGDRFIDADIDVKITSMSGREFHAKKSIVFGEEDENNVRITDVEFIDLVEWGFLKKEYISVEEGVLKVECQMRIKKMIRIYKENIRSFGESMKEFSDVVMIVGGQKFYVLSKFLAAQSSYFKAMFSGKFNETSQSEINLIGIDADDFQNYLEVLYGEAAIDNLTVEGILIISEMYDTPTVTRRCEEFLMDKTSMNRKTILELAVRFNLEKLKEDCVLGVRSMSDIRESLPSDIRDLDPSVAIGFLEKAVSFKRQCLKSSSK